MTPIYLARTESKAIEIAEALSVEFPFLIEGELGIYQNGGFDVCANIPAGIDSDSAIDTMKTYVDIMFPDIPSPRRILFIGADVPDEAMDLMAHLMEIDPEDMTVLVSSDFQA